MELSTLKTTTRDGLGKGAARRLRAKGWVPAVLYGGGEDPLSLALDSSDFIHVMHAHAGEHAVVQLEVTDNAALNHPALIKSVQHHPIRGDVVHVDFLRIRLDQRIQTTVPVVLEGRSPGVIEGGLLDHQLRQIEVECLALEVPEVFAVDISSLNIGDSLHVSDMPKPEGLDILTDAQRAIVAVLAPRLAAAEEEAEGEEEAAEGAAAEPEVIGKKAEEE